MIELTKDTLLSWMREGRGEILRDPENPGIVTGYITFYPERARAALQCNEKSRAVNENQISVLVQSINAGIWDPNVSKINFDENMILSDGQHRLLSIQRSGKAVRCLVTVGMGQLAQGVTDRRGARSLSNDMQIAQLPSAGLLASLTRVHFLFEKGVEIQKIVHNARASYTIPDAILLQHYFDHEAEVQQMKNYFYAAEAQVRNLKIKWSVLHVLAPAFANINEEDATFFWQRLGKGVFSEADDPIRMLRLRLEANAVNSHTSMNKVTQAALIIKAWNYYINGTSIKTLKYTVGGAHPEKFPSIVNPYV